MEYYIYKDDNALVHWGVKGMKWGVRRYQNEDGSLTSAGRKRYENADGSLNEAGKDFYRKQDAARRASRIPTQSAKDSTLATSEMTRANVTAKTQAEFNKLHPEKNKLKDTKHAVDSASDAVNRLSNLEKQNRPKPKIQRMDLSKMSDKDMRDQINRELLERQYHDMFAPRKVNRGREIAGKTLQAAGTVLTVAGSALSIAVAIKQLRD